MATIETPPAPAPPEIDDIPVLVVQLQDDLARSRVREAFWISVVVHLLLVILAVTLPRWTNFGRPVRVLTAEQLLSNKELTYLDLPHDIQKVDKAPDTNKLSDKNRIESTRRPTLDRKTLEELQDARRPGAPGQPGPAGPSRPAMPAPPPQMAQRQSGPQAPAAGYARQTESQMQARIQTPPAGGARPNPFAQSLSPGNALEQAARAAAARRAGGGGSGGDYGLGVGSPHGVQSGMEILSDTMGVDFGPYLARVLHDVRINWYNLIPEAARPPMLKKGKVSIVFFIMKTGQVQGMKVEIPSGDVSLDRAAWGGISGSNPFPPLPGEFRGPYLALRFHFFYNPDRNEMR
jgi:TonB family protein